METDNNINPNLISIIVPIYNGQEYVDRCVISILEQTYSDWELLLIDGASDDKSPGLCDLWQARDARIRAFHSTKNKGVSEGRNTGLRNASGAYIMFVDVDDWLQPDCLQRLYEDIQQTDVDIAGCSFIGCSDEDWKKEGCRERNWKEQISEERCKEQDAVKVRGKQTAAEFSKAENQNKTQVSSKRLIAGMDFLKEGILKRDTRCWSKLYKREIVDGHFFKEDYTIGEDMLFVWEVTKEAKFISCSDYAGYCYYHNVNGAMLKRFSKTDIDQIRCWKFLLEHLKDDTCTENNTKADGGFEMKNEAKLQAKHDTDVISKTASILLISCMLIIGKLAALSATERKQYSVIEKQCGDVLKETLLIDGAYEQLDKGYRLKVQLYKKHPNLYMWLYHMYVCFSTHIIQKL